MISFFTTIYIYFYAEIEVLGLRADIFVVFDSRKRACNISLRSLSSKCQMLSNLLFPAHYADKLLYGGLLTLCGR